MAFPVPLSSKVSFIAPLQVSFFNHIESVKTEADPGAVPGVTVCATVPPGVPSSSILSAVVVPSGAATESATAVPKLVNVHALAQAVESDAPFLICSEQL